MNYFQLQILHNAYQPIYEDFQFLLKIQSFLFCVGIVWYNIVTYKKNIYVYLVISHMFGLLPPWLLAHSSSHP